MFTSQYPYPLTRTYRVSSKDDMRVNSCHKLVKICHPVQSDGVGAERTRCDVWRHKLAVNYVI